MVRKSGKTGAPQKFKISGPEPKLTAIEIETKKLANRQESVSISLKYYKVETECLSEWTAAELKKFSSLIEKIRKLNVETLQGYKPLCSPHRNDPNEARFSRPSELSEDLSFFELKVDQSNKARIHGVFVGSTFFLVWLDRLHAVYPEK